MSGFRYILLLLCVTFTLSGCLGTKYLKEDEKILYKQRIKGTQKVNQEELADLYQQTPNKNLLPFIPTTYLVYIYGLGENVFYNPERMKAKKQRLIKKYDKKIAEHKGKPKKAANLISKKNTKLAKLERSIKEGNSLMRMGEKVAVYDPQLIEESRMRMEKLLYSKGFFQAKVSFDTTVIDETVTVTYRVKEGKPHKLAKISYHSKDSALLDIVNHAKKESKLQLGANYDQNLLTAERERLDILLQNNGYFDFSRQYIEFFVDTASLDNRQVEVQVLIRQPSANKAHKVFRLDSVIFTTDANVERTRDYRQEVESRDILFRYYEDKFSKRLLSHRVSLNEDSIYSRESTFNTQRQLANVDMFKFVNINYDTTGGKFVANIYTSPLPKYQLSHEFGVNMSQNFRVPGPFYNLTFKNRNPFGGMEILSVSGLVSAEMVATNNENDGEAIRDSEVGVNVSLAFPQFFLPLGNRLQRRLGSVNPNTNFTAAYNNINRSSYSLENIRTNLAYTWQKQNKQFYNFTLAELTLTKADISADFENFLKEQANKSLESSFKNSLVTSTNLTATYNFGDLNINSRNTSYLKLYLENGGTVLNSLGINLQEDQAEANYQFFRFNADYRQSIPVGKKSSLAYRLNMGVASPYGKDKSMPYLKHFFAGGSYGIRAWQPRQLGPGSTKADPTVLEQPGEVLLEGSIEFRHPLFNFVNGAIFVDAGNVWMINHEQNRPHADFRWDEFYKEIAVGVGYGLRLDFSFLLIRFDTALKFYDPSKLHVEGQSPFVYKNLDFLKPSTFVDKAVFNLGIGYPF